MQKQNLCQGDFMPKNRQHYRKIKYPDKVTKQNALYLSGYFCLVLWEVEMLISRQPLYFIYYNFYLLFFVPYDKTHLKLSHIYYFQDYKLCLFLYLSRTPILLTQKW